MHSLCLSVYVSLSPLPVTNLRSCRNAVVFAKGEVTSVAALQGEKPQTAAD